MPLKGLLSDAAPCQAVQDMRRLKTPIQEEDAGFQYVRTRKPEYTVACTSQGDVSAPLLTHKMDHYVSLPLSDTPIMEKNRDLRQRRRSSLGFRGKRASAILANGSIALPHPNIHHESFFKHISDDLPEPLRMKQLLIWCAKRALDEQKVNGSGKDARAVSLARMIEEEILSDLIENKLSACWYNRKENDVLVKLDPHPRNIENKKKIKEFEMRLFKLKEEVNIWKKLEASFLSCDVKKDLEDLSDERDSQDIVLEDVLDVSLLDSENLKWIPSTDYSELMTWLKKEKANLEFKVDRLYHSLHLMDSFGQVSNQYATQLLGNLAKAIQEREHQTQIDSGFSGTNVKDILKAITRQDK